ncbi:hypothetical protein J7E25_13880 [Agromyces sp. ISL-38]|nr:hypothetical protein [Agromyces sp. ISL-38]MBT2500178.1 hypothetical protein [Agromyces sp. ISL-38]
MLTRHCPRIRSPRYGPLSVPEIADQVGTSVDAVAAATYLARRTLQTVLR